MIQRVVVVRYGVVCFLSVVGSGPKWMMSFFLVWICTNLRGVFGEWAGEILLAKDVSGPDDAGVSIRVKRFGVDATCF